MAEIKRTMNDGCVYLGENKRQCCQEIDDESKYFCEEHKNTSGRYGIDIDLRDQSLRKIAVRKNPDLLEHEKWLLDVQFDTRQFAVRDFMGAYKAALTNRRNGNVKNFRMGFKSKRNPTQIFHIRSGALNCKSLRLFRDLGVGILPVRKKMKRWF